MIEWQNQADFWQMFDSTYRPAGRFLDDELCFDVRLEDLRARINKAPVFTPDEESFPGPVERWYGKISDHLFILTHHYHAPVATPVAVAKIEKNQAAKLAVSDHMKQLLEMNPYA